MNSTDKLSGILRHLLTTVGGAGFVVSQDDLLKLVSALATLIGFAWSLWSKSKQGTGKTPATLPLLAGGLSAFLLLAPLALVPGCANSGSGSGLSVTHVVTPARIEAVTALGAYVGGKAAIAKGHRAELERAQAGLKSMQASGQADLPAIAAALDAAGVPQIASTEGSLVLGAVSSFADIWAGSVQPILESQYTQAVRDGLIRGFELALASPVARGFADTPAADPALDDLRAQAISHRPAR